MLVLARKTDQAILLGDGIRIVILGVSGDRVRIGIEAPREVPILRQELRDAVEEANLDASDTKSAVHRWNTLQAALGKHRDSDSDASERAA
ncbi:MAG: carbon storage regulator [Thermomicrobiales bacterium]